MALLLILLLIQKIKIKIKHDNLINVVKNIINFKVGVE
jgi:hypothetical protein